MKLEVTRFDTPMTVKQLKELIKDWPETDQDGEPTEVWIGTGNGLSNPARELWPLNARTDENGNETASILFE